MNKWKYIHYSLKWGLNSKLVLSYWIFEVPELQTQFTYTHHKSNTDPHNF